MSAETLTPAVLQYIDHGAFPQSEHIASATLTPDNLTHLLEELHKAQDEVKAEIRSLGKTTAPEIDTWIARAKALQADILRSRETARQIVAEAESGKDLSAKVEDASNKVRLLEKEVTFNETLTGTLERLGHVNDLLDEVQETAVLGMIDVTLVKLQEAQNGIDSLTSAQSSSAVGLLVNRLGQLRQGLQETGEECWDGLVQVHVEERRVVILESLRADVPGSRGEGERGIVMAELAEGLKGFGTFDQLVGKLARDLERAIFKPRMTADEDGMIPKVVATKGELKLQGRNEDINPNALLHDLGTIVGWLANSLPPSVSLPLSQSLIPTLTSRLGDWLEPAIPLEVTEIAAFQDMLGNVQNLADAIDQRGWHGASALRDWVKNAPRTWLTKRRESLLGDSRNLVFTGLRQRNEVERVETQVVSKDDTLAGGGEGDDEWDTAWDDPEEHPSAVPSAHAQTEDDDNEGSAWDMDEPDEKPTHGDEEDDAWGWGDGTDDATQKPASPKVTKKEPHQTNGQKTSQRPAEREMTLRETFTVTGIPDAVVSLIRQVIFDAELLAGPQYSSSLIAPVSAALYTLPTLALAIYRATAPTAYSKADTGNMLIYNDASRLSDQLRSWQASQPPASRLRLDNDVKALDQFAKRAYGAEMEAQRMILRDLLDGAQGFSNSTTMPFKIECESAVEQTVHRLREVHKQWTSILAPSALLQSVGSLVATVVGKMITEVEDLPDIGEAESRQLKELCDEISSVRDLFTQAGPDGGEPKDLSFIYCPNWLKFQYLAEIMESSLADIKYLWNEGELSLEFEAEEVVGLIEALFADSGLRRQAINEIRRGGRR